MNKTIATVVLGLAMTASGPGISQAAEPIQLKVASFLPETHHVVQHGTKVLIDRFLERTRGKTEVTFFPAEQAGKAKQLVDLMQAGALDIVEVPLGYYIERFPLFGVVELPGVAPSPCASVKALHAVADPGGVLHKNDIARQGMHSLSYIIFPSYSAVSRVPIRSAEDFKGLKLRIAGGAMEREVANLDGVPVKISSPETYQSLSRGTIDGALFTYLTVKQYDLQDVAKYGTSGYSFGGAIIILMMTEKKFKALPHDIQIALDEAGREAEQSYCRFADDGEADARKAVATAGVTIHEFTLEQKAGLDAKLSSLSDEWAKNLDSRGKPASEVLKQYKAALASQ